jgi:hypothetical protein
MGQMKQNGHLDLEKIQTKNESIVRFCPNIGVVQGD